MSDENEANQDALHVVLMEISDHLSVIARAYTEAGEARRAESTAYLGNMVAARGERLVLAKYRERMVRHVEVMEDTARQNVDALAAVARALDDLAGAFVRRTETKLEDGTVEVKREPEAVPVYTEERTTVSVGTVPGYALATYSVED